mmetsp:Transcript_34972/g.73528  ORF Transcript_34972/g.73528 Transcript_34972/m.73528 type:complete len:89 (-) Transcript_34972:354-620(-)
MTARAASLCNQAAVHASGDADRISLAEVQSELESLAEELRVSSAALDDETQQAEPGGMSDADAVVERRIKAAQERVAALLESQTQLPS